MNIAPSVIATMSTVVRTEARTIFMRLARRSQAAGRRIAQLNENQNAAGSAEQEFSRCSENRSKFIASRTNRRRRGLNRWDSRDRTSRWRAGPRPAVRNGFALPDL